MSAASRPLPTDAAARCLPSLADLLGRALFAVDGSGRVVAWSREAQRLTGLGEEEVLGVALERLDDGPARLGATLREAADAGRAGDLEARWRVAHGPLAGRRLGVRLALHFEDADGLAVGVMRALPSGPGADVDLIGSSAPLREALRKLRRAAESSVTTLIMGESGTGKELAALALHRWSPRSEGPFVAVHCSAIPRELIESELFGHVRGAFTGAREARRGVFEQASGGTLFLDEIGELDEALQVKLLRVLETREVRPIGSDRTVPVDVRLVTATHRDLAEALAAGRVREDFYYRIRVFEVRMPSLRERREDIVPLAEHFLSELSERHQRPGLRFDAGAEAALLAHRWPGNVRELKNAVEHAFVLAEGDRVRATDLPLELRELGDAPVAGQLGALGLPARSGEERRRILDALEAHGWNRTRTAEALGISRVTLWKKIRQHRLDDGTFRGGSTGR